MATVPSRSCVYLYIGQFVTQILSVDACWYKYDRYVDVLMTGVDYYDWEHIFPTVENVSV